MLFYLCKTDEGEQLAPNQTEAKRLDPNYVEHNVPTDKPGLMGWANTLLKRATGHNPEPANIPTPLVDPAEQRVMVAGACPRCALRPRAAETVAKGLKAEEIQSMIAATDRDYLLRNIIEAAKDRLAELGDK